VHMAWAQVALAKGSQTHTSETPQDASAKTQVISWSLGLGAFACVVTLGLACAATLHLEWLDARWNGAWTYIAPLALWQGCACLSAAFSHRPFQTQASHAYSWACMSLGLLQAAVLLLPMGLGVAIAADLHMAAFAAVSSLGLLGLTVWMAKLR
jgi:hypothetical protein